MLIAGNVNANQIGATYNGPLLDGATVTAVFGGIDDAHPEPHSGADLATDPAGDAPQVLGSIVGYVRAIHLEGDGSAMGAVFGNCVIVDCPDDESYLFGHLASVACSVGQSIERVTVLGVEGSTGLSTGRHLHVGRTRTSANPDFLKDIGGGVSMLLDPLAEIVLRPQG